MDTFTSLVRETEAVKKSMAVSAADYRKQLATQWDALFPPRAYLPSSDSERLSRIKEVVM